MATIFIHDGDAIDYTPDQDVAAGGVILQNKLIGVAKHDIPAGTLGALSITGVFEFDYISVGGGTAKVGEKAYWDDANNVMATVDNGGANIYAGKVVEKASNQNRIRVRLDQ